MILAIDLGTEAEYVINQISFRTGIFPQQLRARVVLIHLIWL